jgi:hypothetical protein
VRVLAKLMAEHAEAARGVAEARGGFGRGETLAEVGAQGFILAMGGIGRLQEDGGEVCYFFCAVRRIPTMSCVSEDVKLQGLALPTSAA